MSTKEVEKTADDSADDETDWLYGDDNFEEGESTEKEVFSALIGDVDGVIGLSYQESESDSDDDVCVTIGGIKMGGSQGSSFESSSISLNIKTSVSGSKSRGLDLNAEGNLLEVDVESFEEKPWRKPGADLSDYFNYGFNEDTWKAYCDKQRRLRMSLEILSLGSSSKIMVHQKSNDLLEYSSSKSSGSINVIEGQTGTISRVEGRRRHSADENNIQVVSEHSSDTELSSPKLSPFFPSNIPPPPFPPPPLIPPPGFPLLPGAPPPIRPTTDSSGRLAGGYDGRSAPPYPFPAGVYSPAVGMSSWPGMIDNGKAWEYYARKQRNREKEKEKTRERGHRKDRERERERERYREMDREHSPSSQDHKSEEERPSRHRDHSHYGSDRYRENSGRDGESDRRRERRHGDRHEQHRSSRSGHSRRRHESGDTDSHRRNRHKRSRHHRESREPSEECSADQENQSEKTNSYSSGMALGIVIFLKYSVW
ncbi:pre-mRNA 3'-end-processing factor FIP1-like isoform X2 [Myxocyprinus asiaticus]|uniref:pre-mRNA 3'-end-processing factor FIP1-like isoform X2 n=1 Tax=Myxocyprinus asiaticus TaxID=70543 RepID=UPI002221C522|nr:pre-mRNA 3'-end-processing factor FIP1-like isoform X2 [Myxocyprinus asiaticus]